MHDRDFGCVEDCWFEEGLMCLQTQRWYNQGESKQESRNGLWHVFGDSRLNVTYYPYAVWTRFAKVCYKELGCEVTVHSDHKHIQDSHMIA